MRRPAGDPPEGWHDYQFDLRDEEVVFEKLKGDGSLWLFVYGMPLPRPVYMRLGLVSGRLACTGLFLGLDLSFEPQVNLQGHPAAAGGVMPVRAKDLETVKIREILNALEHDLERYEHWLDQLGSGNWLTVARQKAHRPNQLPRPGPRGLTEEQLRAFADVYRARMAASPNATQAMQAIADEMGKDLSTVYRWKKRAADAGLLDYPMGEE